MSPQAFLIRYVTKERALRSIGAAPNGIVGLTMGQGEASWMIDAKFEPADLAGVTPIQAGKEDAARRATPVEVADVVAGCESPDELFRIAAQIIGATQMAIATGAPERDFPTIRAAVDLLEDTMMAIEGSLHERGVADA